MDISPFLIELLRLHDCVIVPDLGGFVANYRPAETDLAGNGFYPPRKEIIFSPKLISNDGLLVNHISESEGIGYMEARLIISEYVDETMYRLENGEPTEIPMIGSLAYDSNGKLVFEPDIRENLLLDAYGLEAFHFPQLRHGEFFISRRHLHDKEAIRPVFSSRRVKTLAVAFPILLALLIIPSTKNSWDKLNIKNYQASVTVPLSEPAAIISTDIKNEPAQSLNISTQSIAEKTKVSQSGSKQQISNHLKYRIIGGCFRIKENAENMLSRLKSSGFESNLEQVPNGNYIVTIQSYTDKEEAILALKSLRDKEPNAGYWMSVK